jgi:hypothetical protein
MSADEQAMERVAEAEREMARGKKPAVAVLGELMTLSLGLAAFFQPRPAGMEPNPHFNEQAFRYYAEFARDCAKALASYETPALRAIAAPAPTDQKTIRFKLNVFENGRRVGVDFQSMTDDELVRHYRSRIAAGPAASETIEHDANELPAAAAKDAPEPRPEPAAPSQPAEAPIEAPVSEPAASVAPPAPVAQPAAPPNVFRFPEAPKTVQEYADSIASAVGPDGRPRAVNAKAISQAALSRAAMPSTRSARMPRRSGVSDR